MIAALPSPGDIRCATVTATGTAITIPAGRIFCGDIFIAAGLSVAGTATPRVSITGGGTGVEPAANTVIHQLSMTGLALSTVTQSGTIEIVARAGSADAQLDFNLGGASSATCTINGFLL